MTEQQQAHLFEPFNRLGAERSGVEGTGIGPYEGGHIQVETNGRVNVATGVTTQGQGHQTAFAQIVATKLTQHGITYRRIDRAVEGAPVDFRHPARIGDRVRLVAPARSRSGRATPADGSA